MRITVASQVNRDPVKHCLVEPFALFRAGVPVKPTCVAEQDQHEVDMFADESHVVLAGGDEATGIIHLSEQLGLARFEVFGGDGVFEIGIDQLLLLALEFNQALPLVGKQRVIALLPDVQLGSAELAYFADGLARELDLGLPDMFDLLFNLLDRHVGQVAAGPTCMAPEAEEVAVDAALAAGVAIAHASTAAVASQRPFQVVSVSPRAVARDAPSSQNVLHEVPRFGVDQRLMGTVVNNVSVTNLAHIVRIREHPVHLRVVQRSPDVLQRRATLQPSFFELISQCGDAPLPGRIGLESPADVLDFFFVERDAFDFAALDAGKRVDVPDRGDPVSATIHGLLGDALLRLIREVARVELGHPSKDVVH
ncbi:MAG: hypothetical protein ABI130_07580 [Leifsonia sp.]